MDGYKEAPIGVFDSGVGGLTVAREIMRQLPNERIVYFGDTARVPYGSKSKENILKYSIVSFLYLRCDLFSSSLNLVNLKSFEVESIKILFIVIPKETGLFELEM